MKHDMNFVLLLDVLNYKNGLWTAYIKPLTLLAAATAVLASFGANVSSPN